MWVWLGDFAYADQRIFQRDDISFGKIEKFIPRVPLSVARNIYRKIGGHYEIHEEDKRYLYNLTYSNESK